MSEFRLAFHNKVHQITESGTGTDWINFSLNFDTNKVMFLDSNAIVGEREFEIIDGLKFCVLYKGCLENENAFTIITRKSEQSTRFTRVLGRFYNLVGYHQSAFVDSDGKTHPPIDTYAHCGTPVTKITQNGDEVLHESKELQTNLLDCRQNTFVFINKTNEQNAYFESEEVQFLVSDIKRKQEIENREGIIKNIGESYTLYRRYEGLCETNSFFSNSLVDELKDITEELIEFSLMYSQESEHDVIKDAAWDLSEELLAKPDFIFDLVAVLPEAGRKKACDLETPENQELIGVHRMGLNVAKKLFDEKKPKERKTREF